MHLWQQHFMYKQVQELQRQQQLQQFDQRVRQHNSFSQLSGVSKQSLCDQLPPFINGVPVNDAANCIWPGELVGDESKIPSTPQMFMAGNMNWQRSGPTSLQAFSNGLMFSHDQGQALCSMGFVPQQINQSSYDSPAGGTVNPYSHFQGVSHDSADMLSKLGVNQVEKQIIQPNAFNSFQGATFPAFPDQLCLQNGASAAKLGFQEKNLFGHTSLQTLSGGATLGNGQQVNHLSRDVQMQEFHDRQEGDAWEGNLQEKAMAHVVPSQGLVNLDATEEKILFNTDEATWDATLSRTGGMSEGSYLNGNHLEGTDHLNAFPSVQSGSWSALMLSAVAETSSSDTGLQDEWSGLSFQKPEASAGNHPRALGSSGKHPTTCVDKNLQAASSLTSRPFPLFDDSNMSPSPRNVSDFQQSTVEVAVGESERVRISASHESLKGFSKASELLFEGSPRVRTESQLGSTSEGIFGTWILQQSYRMADSAVMEFNSQNMQDSLVCPQSISSCNTSSQSYKMNGWNINEPLSPNGENIMKHAHNSEHKGSMPMERDHVGVTWKVDGNLLDTSFQNSSGSLDQENFGQGSQQVYSLVSSVNDLSAPQNSGTSKINREMNQHVPCGDQFGCESHAAVDSSAKYDRNESVGKYQHQQSSGPQVPESSNNSYRGSRDNELHDKKGDNYYQKEISDSNSSGHSHPGRHTVIGSGMRENSWLNASDSHHVVHASHKSAGQVGKSSGSWKFHYHPMRDLGADVELVDLSKQVTHSQVLPVAQGLRSEEQGYYDQSSFASDVVSHNATSVEKGRLPDLLRDAKGAEDVHSGAVKPSGHEATVFSSFYGPASLNAQNWIFQPSHNMLKFFHKVDQSKNGNTITNSGSSVCKASEVPEQANSNASAAQLQQAQSSALKGFGLQLAPPSQCLSNANHYLSLQTSPNVAEGNMSLHHGQEVLEEGQMQLMTADSVQSLQPVHGASQKEHWDNQATSSEQKGNDISCSGAHGSTLPKAVPSVHHPSSQRQVTDISRSSGPSDLNANDSHGVTVNRSAQASLFGASGRIPPADTRGPVGSAQSSTNSTGHTQLLNPSPSHLKGSGQQPPILQPSAASGMSQKGAFSSMLHNMQINMSARQYFSDSRLNNVPPNLFQSIQSHRSNLEANPLAPQKGENYSVKGGNGPCKFGAWSVNSQQVAHDRKHPGEESSMQHVMPERVDHQVAAATYRGQESVAKNIPDVTSVTSSSLAAPDQHDHVRSKDGQELLVISQSEHVYVSEDSGNSLKPSDALHQNFSLLHQIKSMKCGETDPTSKSGKRLKGADFSTATQKMFACMNQQFASGYDRTVRGPVDNELSAAAAPRSLFEPQDSKMLCILSEGNDDQNANASSQICVRDTHSNDMGFLARNDPQYHSGHPNTTSTPLLGANEHSRVNLLMAPSWFEQYGACENGLNLSVQDELDSSKSHTKSAVQRFSLGKTSECSLHTYSVNKQANSGENGQVGSAWRSPTSTLGEKQFSSSHPLHLDGAEHHLVVMGSKKRKSMASELLPWRKKVSEASERLLSISMAEVEWAQASNRRIEKVEDDAEMIQGGLPIPEPRKRLTLTTLLMQQLLRSIPTAILSAQATSEYESVTYFCAKLALGDACSLMSCSGIDFQVHPDSKTMASEKFKAVSKVVEDCISRVRKMENDLLRLEKRESILDIRVECQDLERFSIINHFARFHGRGNAPDGTESSLVQRTYSQRYVTAHPNLPQGVLCLSL